MNNGNGAEGQPGQGQASGAQDPRRSMQLFRPEQMRNLPGQFTPEEKTKWETGLRQLWTTMEGHAPDTPQHQDAKNKLLQFSKTLTAKIQTFRAQAQAAQQAVGARPASQRQSQGQGGESNGANPPGAQQRQPPKISANIMEHVNTFPFIIPSQLTQGSQEAVKWLNEAKNRYVKGLMTMETASGRLKALEGIEKKRNEEGKPFSPEEEKEFKEKKEAFEKQHSEAKSFVDGFRAQQKNAQRASQQGHGPQQGGNGNANGGQTPVRPQANLQQPSNPALQNTQTVNAAIEAARNQQMVGVRPSMQQNGQAPQNANAPSTVPQHQGGQVQAIKQEAGVPQINTQMGGRPMQQNGSPQSAVPQSAQSIGPPQSATSAQVPRALTHQVALQTAARTYSSGQTSGTPNVMGHSHPHPPAPRETQNVMTNKMPIPKHLPERATAQPQPVAMPQPRPTYSGGPSNSGSGVMSQPALSKTPGYSMEGDGGRVLSKKKLDELVRQVTGGGDSTEGGESLTPDVESVCVLLLFLC
jgi:transcription initiation factor TFIID subunit 12